MCVCVCVPQPLSVRMRKKEDGTVCVCPKQPKRWLSEFFFDIQSAKSFLTLYLYGYVTLSIKQNMSRPDIIVTSSQLKTF